MPQIGFKCPDGQCVTHSECMKSCRIANSFKTKRCLPLPYLAACIPDRPPGTKLSVTALQRPIIQTVLEYCEDYYVNPIARYNLVRGSMSHYLLEIAKNNIPKEQLDKHLFEVRYRNSLFSGQIDYYNGVDEILFDYKFVNGQKAYKMRTNVSKNAHDYVMQVNAYRILLEENLHRVKDMFIVAFAYNTQYTGGNKSPVISMVSVPFLDKEVVMSEMSTRASNIVFYRDAYPETIPEACEETWDGKRCNAYCDVSDFCPFKQELKERKSQKDEAEEPSDAS